MTEATGSHLEMVLEILIAEAELPTPEREYRFALDIVGPEAGLRERLKAAGLRDWRFDFAWPELGVAVEVEGGIWARGRHVRGAGFEKDCEKYNAAALHNWRVFRFTGGMIEDGTAMETIMKVLPRSDTRCR